MKKIIIITVSLLFAVGFQSISAQHNHASHGNADTAINLLPGPGEKIQINDTHYFTYSFDKKPAVGTTLLIIKVFNTNNKQVTPYSLYADLDMPSMRGAHPSLDMEFQKKDGGYILPLKILMRGEWETEIKIKDSGREVFTGRIFFRASS